MRSIEAWEKAMTIEETIYPIECYYINGKPDYKAPYQIIRRKLEKSNLSYFSIMDNLINKQNKISKRRGADLPFIGENYFSDRKGIRVMMVMQDSDAPRAGSIVFFGPLLEENYSQDDYHKIRKKCNNFLTSKQFDVRSYRYAVDTLAYWNIDVSFLYLTDARKVHCLNKDGYDENLSLNIIQNEIEAVLPDILVPAGDVAYKFLRKLAERDISTTNGEICFYIRDIPVVRAPFFTGRGRQGNFDDKSKRTKATLEVLQKELEMKWIFT